MSLIGRVAPFLVGPTDPYLSSVVLLTHMEGTDGGSTFTDSSSYGRTFTNFGSPTTSSTQAKFGTTSMRTSSNTSGISVVLPAIGTSDFTMEGWLRLDYISGNQAFWLDALYASTGFELYVNNTGHLAMYGAGADRCTSTTILTTGVWYHIAFTRTSGTLRWFINGVVDATTGTLTTNFTATTYYLGYTVSGNVGYMDEVRFTFGVSRYTTTFTPPGAPY